MERRWCTGLVAPQSIYFGGESRFFCAKKINLAYFSCRHVTDGSCCFVFLREKALDGCPFRLNKLKAKKHCPLLKESESSWPDFYRLLQHFCQANPANVRRRQHLDFSSVNFRQCSYLLIGLYSITLLFTRRKRVFHIFEKKNFKVLRRVPRGSWQEPHICCTHFHSWRWILIVSMSLNCQ